MGEMLLIGGVIGLVLWLAGSGSAKAEPNTIDPGKVKKPPVPPAKAAACKDCMCPDATITLAEAQRALIALKFLPATTPSGKKGDDGVCGILTSTAIRNYQVARKLTVSGFVDKQTSDALKGSAGPITATPSSTPAEKVAATDYADGCNAGSKDAGLSSSHFWNEMKYGNPLADIKVKDDNYDAVSGAWDDGYRTCFTAALTRSGILLDEDGNMYVGELLDDDVTIIGEVLDESEAEEDEDGGAVSTGVKGLRRLFHTRASRARTAAVAGRARVRRMFL